MLFFVFLGILTCWVVLKLTGFILDSRVDKNVEEFCLFHTDGVLQGAESREFVSQKETAVIFIHGFTDSPRVFDEIISELSCPEVDIFVPLLPFHGRALQEMKDFNPSVIENYVGAFIDLKERGYKKLILIGQSLGSTILIRLSQSRQWSPKHISLILLAPAVYLFSQGWLYRLGYNFYPHFRNYWPQATAKTMDAIEQATAYYAISAVKRLQYYCQKTEKILREMAFPHTVLIAKNDNRVNVGRLQEICQRSLCQFVLFEKGSHLLYQGEQIPSIVQYIRKAMR